MRQRKTAMESTLQTTMKELNENGEDISFWKHETERYLFAAICDQGDRLEQMDRTNLAVSCQDMHGEDDHHVDVDNNGLVVLALFDGHSDPRIAEYLKQSLADDLRHYLSKSPTVDIPYLVNHWFPSWNKRLLHYLLCSSPNSNSNGHNAWRGGSTACVVFTHNGVLYCANLGDCKAVLSRNGTCLPLSVQHRYCNEAERTRVISEGGYFARNGRIGSSGLAVCRSFGDFHCYDQKSLQDEDLKLKCLGFSCKPDIHFMNMLDTADEFVLLASDGVWDRCNDINLVNFIRLLLIYGEEETSILKKALQYVKRCGRDAKKDNMTLAIIFFKKQESIDILRQQSLKSYISSQLRQAHTKFY